MKSNLVLMPCATFHSVSCGPDIWEVAGVTDLTPPEVDTFPSLQKQLLKHIHAQGNSGPSRQFRGICNY